jgi:hypothetical protein
LPALEVTNLGLIACLGWGSLIWDGGSLPVEGEWRTDGPHLPLEFARQSSGNRITLVIVAGGDLIPALWSQLTVASMEEAISALADREGVTKADVIGRWPNHTSARYPCEDVIGDWARGNGLSGVVWTALPPGMAKARHQVPALKEILRYFDGLADGEQLRAAEYIAKAPPQIRTPYREELSAYFRARGNRHE